MNNNIDISKLLETLSKMNKSELEAGIAKANKILGNKNNEDIIKNLNDNIKS